LGGQLRGLTAFDDPLDDRGREKRQPDEPTDVLLADRFAASDLDHRATAAAHQIVKPAVCARY
jgi:hypothetical protein